jgi:hypothetical protein
MSVQFHEKLFDLGQVEMRGKKIMIYLIIFNVVGACGGLHIIICTLRAHLGRGDTDNVFHVFG